MANELRLIRKTKRLRVGGSGPKRSELKTFQKIGEVSPLAVDVLNRILDENQGNDLGGDGYSISKQCNFEAVFNANNLYRQILLQKCIADHSHSVDEYLYDQWRTFEGLDRVKLEISKFVLEVFRMRLSEMKKGHSLNWHIDTDPSVICRAQICLKANNDVFEFNRRGSVEFFKMKPGEIFFVNTGWSHRVVN